MDETQKFEQEKKENILALGKDNELRELGFKFVSKTADKKYSYNYSWMGRPIIQFPQDMVAMQELIWEIKPDLIIETGIAHGGSLVFYASILELLGNGEVLGIDIDIREHNRVEIEKHPMYKRINMLEGSSISPEIIKQVEQYATGKKKVLVLLDSNHTHEHVLEELKLYSPFVSIDSYLVVFDTVVEFMDDEAFEDRPWGKGNNPLTAVNSFLKTTDNFELDILVENKLLITVAPKGYLKRVK